MPEEKKISWFEWFLNSDPLNDTYDKVWDTLNVQNRTFNLLRKVSWSTEATWESKEVTEQVSPIPVNITKRKIKFNE